VFPVGFVWPRYKIRWYGRFIQSLHACTRVASWSYKYYIAHFVGRFYLDWHQEILSWNGHPREGHFLSSGTPVTKAYHERSTAGIPNLFSMATHLTKPPRFRDTPLTVRPTPPPSTRLEKKIQNYIIKTNKVNLTARFSYLMSKAEFRPMTSDFKI
jgi:hypothetical protein